jgi:hypothetical protein
MTPTNPGAPFTPFIPTTYNIPEEDDRQKIFLQDTFNKFSDVVNDKTIGAFTQDTEEFNGEKWIYDNTRTLRNGYQAIARIKSFIPQTIPLPIGDVNSQFIMTLTYGTASFPCTAVGANDGVYFSFFSQGDARIQFTVSDTQIIITTNGTTSAYQGFIIIQYVRDGT